MLESVVPRTWKQCHHMGSQNLVYIYIYVDRNSTVTSVCADVLKYNRTRFVAFIDPLHVTMIGSSYDPLSMIHAPVLHLPRHLHTLVRSSALKIQHKFQSEEIVLLKCWWRQFWRWTVHCRRSWRWQVVRIGLWWLPVFCRGAFSKSIIHFCISIMTWRFKSRTTTVCVERPRLCTVCDVIAFP